MKRWTRFLCAGLAAALLVACSARPGTLGLVPSSGGSAPDSGRVIPGAHRRTTMTLHVKIPKRVRTKSHFISPSTQSMSLAIAPGAGCSACSPAISENVGLTPASPGCGQTYAETNCTFTFTLAPGSYAGNITTYDGPVGCQTARTCNALSSNQLFPVQIVAGQANDPSIALYGVPYYLVAAPTGENASAVQDGMSSEILVGGTNTTATFALYSEDADGNMILGPGSPTYALAASPPLNWSARFNGNLLTIVTGASFPSQFFGTVAFPISVKSEACSLSSYCNPSLYVGVNPQIALADPGDNEVHVMFAGVFDHFSTYATVTDGIDDPVDVKFCDTNGDLYVANAGNDTVTVYAPPYTGKPAATISTAAAPSHLAVSEDGLLAIGVGSAPYSVSVYSASPYSGSPEHISLSSAPASLAVYSNNDDVWVATPGSVRSYGATDGYAAPQQTIGIGDPTGIDVDYYENLYVADSSANALDEFTAASSYGSESTVGNLTGASDVSAFIAWATACYSGGAQTFFEGLGSLRYVLSEPSGQTCAVATDYLGNVWTAAYLRSKMTQLNGTASNSFSYQSYNVSAMAFFPSAHLR